MHPSVAVMAPSAAALRRSLSRPATRRIFTSSFFWATFCGAILTVSLSASSFLPCPATISKGQFTRRIGAAGESETNPSSSNEGEEQARRQSLVHGERIRLTKKGGWIEIEERKPRRPQADDMCASGSTYYSR